MTSMEDKNDKIAQMAELIGGLNATLYSAIPLTRGYKAVVDNIYLNHIMQFSWFAVVGRGGIVYAKTTQIIKGKQVTLQKYIWGLHTVGHYSDDLEQLTFKNKVTLDCRFTNILPYTGRQNVMRYRAKRPSGSRYKGVRVKPSGRFSATIYDGIRQISLGTHDAEVTAAKVYDEAAKLIFDDAGYLNFPNEPSDLEALELAAVFIKRSKRKD